MKILKLSTCPHIQSIMWVFIVKFGHFQVIIGKLVSIKKDVALLMTSQMGYQMKEDKYSTVYDLAFNSSLQFVLWYWLEEGKLALYVDKFSIGVLGKGEK